MTIIFWESLKTMYVDYLHLFNLRFLLWRHSRKWKIVCSRYCSIFILILTKKKMRNEWEKR
jgi:hypothetical protein